MECPHFLIPALLESRLERGRRIGGEAAFHCPRGFDMRGERTLKCLRSGEQCDEYRVTHLLVDISSVSY